MGYADTFQLLLSRCCSPERARPWGASLFAEFCFHGLISPFSQDTVYFLMRSAFILSRKILISPELQKFRVSFPHPFLLPFHLLLFPNLFLK